MKQLAITLCIAVAIHTHLTAQSCIPMPGLPDSVIFFPSPYQEGIPGSGIQDTACVGVPFETILHLNVPSQIESQFGTFPVNSIDMPTQGAFLNLPASLNYACNPPNCIFKKDSTGCIVLFGTPQPGEEAVYDLKINVTIRSVLDLPYTFPDGFLVPGNYDLHVKPAGNPNCQSTSAAEPANTKISVFNRPNPFSDYTEFVVNIQHSGQFRLTITDVFGRQFHQQSVDLQAGENIIPFQKGALPAGCHLFMLENKSVSVGGRIVILNQ